MHQYYFISNLEYINDTVRYEIEKNSNSSEFKIFTSFYIERSERELLQKFLIKCFRGQFAKLETNNAEYFYEYFV